MIEVTLADAKLFLDHRDNLFTAGLQSCRSGCAGTIGGGAIRTHGLLLVPPFRAPALCALIEIDAALVIEDIDNLVIRGGGDVADRHKIATAAKTFGIDGAVLVGKEEVFQLLPEALVLGGNFSRGCRLLSGDDANAVAGNPGFRKAFDGGIRIAAVFEEGRHRVR